MARIGRLSKGIVGLVGALVLAGSAWTGSAWAQLPEGAKLPSAEERTTVVLPEASPHWAYLFDPVFPHLIVTKVWIVDGDKLDVVGMFNTGYTSNLGIAPDNSELYVAESFWSRGSRGERSDMVTFFDSRTLEPTGEVSLPRGRFLVVNKKYNAALTTDGRYMLSFNMAPATSVSVVDVKTRTYVTDIETPGCALVYPTGPTRFSMLCADGSLLTVIFDGSGNAQMTRGEPFFDAENDPVFEHSGFSPRARKAYFISYGGMVYPVDLSGDTPQFGETWSLVSPDEKGKWSPGGWQLSSYHPQTNRLFVQMHEGGKWTHKSSGEEVWVFDVEQKKRLARIKLTEAAWSSMVTQDDNPLLFTHNGGDLFSVYDATTYEHKGDVGEVGISPHIFYVIGE